MFFDLTDETAKFPLNQFTHLRADFENNLIFLETYSGSFENLKKVSMYEIVCALETGIVADYNEFHGSIDFSSQDLSEFPRSILKYKHEGCWDFDSLYQAIEELSDDFKKENHFELKCMLDWAKLFKDLWAMVPTDADGNWIS